MERGVYVFKNNGLTEYNDSVFESSEFDLDKNNYRIKLLPSIETRYWRFGVIISKTKDFRLDPTAGRYTDKNLRYIEINVGNKVKEKWGSERTISLTSYFITDFANLPKINNSYFPSAPVQISLHKSFDKVEFSLFSNGISEKESFPIGEYRFFKLSTWADEIPFEINCEIEVIPKNDKNNTPVFIESASAFSISDNFIPTIQVTELATEIASLLRELKDEKGNMFGIFGEWGRGKTFLWHELWKKLCVRENENSTEYIKVEFHAWKYQDTPAVWAYLYESLSDCFFKFENKISVKEGTTKKTKSGFNINNLSIIFINVWFKIFNPIKVFSKRVKLNSIRLGYRPFLFFIFSISLSSPGGNETL